MGADSRELQPCELRSIRRVRIHVELRDTGSCRGGGCTRYSARNTRCRPGEIAMSRPLVVSDCDEVTDVLMPLILDYGTEREAAAMAKVRHLLETLNAYPNRSPLAAAMIEAELFTSASDYAEQLRLEGAIAEAKWWHFGVARRLDDDCPYCKRIAELEVRLREIVEKSKAREAK